MAAQRTEAQRYWSDVERQRKHGRLELQLPPEPIRRSPREEVTKSISYFDNFVTHPGTSLTPQQLVAIFRAAEVGNPMEQCDLFEDLIETDGHLRSVIAARTLAVAGKKWQMKAGGPRPIDTTAAEMLEAALRKTNFADLVAHLLNTRYFGYSASEIVWESVGGTIVPTWFINVPCRRFRFDEFDRPRLITEKNFEGLELQVGQWVFGKNTTSQITARSGLMRTAAWFSLFKRYSWRDWIVYAEKYGIPLAIGKWQEGATEEDKAALEEAVHDIGTAGQVTMSENTEIEIREASEGGDSTNLHSSIVKEANKEISKLITGSTLTVEQGSPGSFALGEVHADRSYDLVRSDERFVGRRIDRDVAMPFLEFNGLQDAAIPKLIIHISKNEGLARVKETETLWNMGLALDTEQLREEHNLRAPPTPDRVLPPPLAPAPPPVQGNPDDDE